MYHRHGKTWSRAGLTAEIKRLTKCAGCSRPCWNIPTYPLFDDMEFKYGRKADSSAEKPEFDFSLFNR